MNVKTLTNPGSNSNRGHVDFLKNLCNNLEKSIYQFWQIHVTTPSKHFDKSNNLRKFSKSTDLQGKAMHIVTVARKCLVSRDDTRQFWSRPDQNHDNSGRDANCISRC